MTAIAPERCTRFLNRLRGLGVGVHGAEVIEAQHTYDGGCEGGGERGFGDGRVVRLPLEDDVAQFHAEGPLQRRTASNRADQEPVGKPVGDRETIGLQVVHDPFFLSWGWCVKGVELVGREKLLVDRRRGVLDVGEELLEGCAISQLEANNEAIFVGWSLATVIW